MGLIDFLRRLFAAKKTEPHAAPSQPGPRPAVQRPAPPRPPTPTAAPTRAAPTGPVRPGPAAAPTSTAKPGRAPAPMPLPKPVVQPEPPTPAPPVPLKPDHRRLALHDERFTHKQAPQPHTVTARRPPKERLTRDEARRLFSPTLRSAARNLRTLVTDEAQLARYGLPVWHNETALAAALALEPKALRHFSMHSAKDRAPHYVTFAIPKRSGGERLIMAPKTRLKRLQRRLNALLVSKLPASEFAHGFRHKRSVRSNAEPHVGRGVILQLDLKDFFGSIHFGRVRGLLIALGYGYPVATALAALMTEAPRQPVVVGGVRYFPPTGARACPQGAPTSPGLSNAVVVKMDRRLAGLARRHGFTYTRYADDLTFSGDDIAAAHALRLLGQRVIEEEGFELNQDKTRIRRSGTRQTVTGVVVNDVLGLSRQERRRLRAAIHRYAAAHAAGHADAAQLVRLDGKVAYLAMLNAAQARRLSSR